MAADHVAEPKAQAAEKHKAKSYAQQQHGTERHFRVSRSFGRGINLVLDRTNSFSVKDFWHETSSSFHLNSKNVAHEIELHRRRVLWAACSRMNVARASASDPSEGPIGNSRAFPLCGLLAGWQLKILPPEILAKTPSGD
jgi:hypothetical protein